MAGDWIKVTHAVLDKPEIRKTARMLGVKHGEALELYLRWWVWLDVNSVDGLVDACVDADVDELLHCPGFAATMRAVGWLETDEATGQLRVSGFELHNGESSKKRALKNKRQANWRESVDARVDAAPSTKASTREEKRRDTTEREIPTPEHRDLATALAVDCDVEWVKYQDHQKNAKRKHSDLEAGFRNWIRRAHEFKPPIRAASIQSRQDARATVLAGHFKDHDDGPRDITGEAKRVA
jgi:hypothetical protein